MTGVLDPLREAIRAAGESGREPATRLATVTGVSAAGALVQFDGEGTASARRYLFAGAGAIVGDRVLMHRAGSSWVVGTTVSTLAWTAFPFAAFWGNYGLGGHRVCGYRRVGRMVKVRGLAAVASGGGFTLGTLPPEFRPAGVEVFITYSADGPQRIDVNTDGTVTFPSWIGTLNPGDWVSLAPIYFEADG